MRFFLQLQLPFIFDSESFSYNSRFSIMRSFPQYSHVKFNAKFDPKNAIFEKVGKWQKKILLYHISAFFCNIFRYRSLIWRCQGKPGEAFLCQFFHVFIFFGKTDPWIFPKLSPLKSWWNSILHGAKRLPGIFFRVRIIILKVWDTLFMMRKSNKYVHNLADLHISQRRWSAAPTPVHW